MPTSIAYGTAASRWTWQNIDTRRPDDLHRSTSASSVWGWRFVAAGAALTAPSQTAAATASTLPSSLRAGVLFFGGLAFVALLLSLRRQWLSLPALLPAGARLRTSSGQGAPPTRGAGVERAGRLRRAGDPSPAAAAAPWLATLFAGLVVGAVYLFGML